MSLMGVEVTMEFEEAYQALPYSPVLHCIEQPNERLTVVYTLHSFKLAPSHCLGELGN